MKREVSNSMSEANDPCFDVITPICKACRNFIKDGKCKSYGEIPKEYKYAKKYSCPKSEIEKNNINYKYIKDKIKS